MKRALILTAILVCFSVVSVKTISMSQKGRCLAWMAAAEAEVAEGYYASAIKTLTHYFSVPKCRSKQDVRAVELLATSRLFVPLPENAELAQQVMLSRLGLQLGRSARAKTSLASAHLVQGEWSKALIALEGEHSRQALLIRLTSLAALGDMEGIEFLLQFQQVQRLSHFEIAVVQELLVSRGREISSIQAAQIDYEISQFARFVVSPTSVIMPAEDIRKIAQHLDDENLAFASSLLLSKGEGKVAEVLLDQPERPLSRQLLVRLADIFWRQGDYEKLNDSFLLRQVDKAMPAEAQLYVCLAGLNEFRGCKVNFKYEDQLARFGAFVADSWAGLFRQLEAPEVNAAKVLDQLHGMRSLLRGNGLVSALESHLYQEIGEQSLARHFARQAAALSYSPTFPVSLLAQPPEWRCSTGEEGCTLQVLNDYPLDLRLWRTAIESGYQPTIAQSKLLQKYSPDQASLWRLVQAKALISQGDDKSMAEAILLLRPVERWAEGSTKASLMSAVAHAHFKDAGAAFMRLAVAVKNAPDESVQTLKLAVGLYERGQINHNQLLHWWRALTLLELKARGVPADENLLTERLSLLAAYGEERSDRQLLIAVYEELLRLDGENHVALNNMAYHLAMSGERLEAAQRMAEKALRLSPEQQAYQDTIETVQEAIEASSDA